jgi:hypothetical protein
MHYIIIVIFDGHFISAEDDVGRHTASIALAAIIIGHVVHQGNRIIRFCCSALIFGGDLS